MSEIVIKMEGNYNSDYDLHDKLLSASSTLCGFILANHFKIYIHAAVQSKSVSKAAYTDQSEKEYTLGSKSSVTETPSPY
jgi:hypothetical protein